MSFFHHTLTFAKTDPLDDGLGDDIEAERSESNAFSALDEQLDGSLAEAWSHILDEEKADPEVTFVTDEG